MKLGNQVVSLKLAKCLKELNCKQESLWWWIIRAEGNPIIVGKDKRYTTTFISSSYSAFTVAELGELLPKDYYSQFNGDQWMCLKEAQRIEFANTEANARAKMLIWLIENKMMEV